MGSGSIFPPSDGERGESFENDVCLSVEIRNGTYITRRDDKGTKDDDGALDSVGDDHVAWLMVSYNSPV